MFIKQRKTARSVSVAQTAIPAEETVVAAAAVARAKAIKTDIFLIQTKSPCGFVSQGDFLFDEFFYFTEIFFACGSAEVIDFLHSVGVMLRSAYIKSGFRADNKYFA